MNLYVKYGPIPAASIASFSHNFRKTYVALTIKVVGVEGKQADRQCDQIGRFIGLWAPFQSLWQHLVGPNLPHS